MRNDASPLRHPFRRTLTGGERRHGFRSQEIKRERRISAVERASRVHEGLGDGLAKF